jgi:hypothetical protein
MHSLIRVGAVALVTFASTIAGMLIQLTIPAHALTDARGTVGAMVGLVTLLLALVLGLLIWTSFSVYTTQQAEAQSLAPVVIELDLALEQYGPEAALGRQRLREALARSRERYFGDVTHGPKTVTLEETRAGLRGMGSYFDSLQPASEAQKQLLATAKQLTTSFAQTQMLMSRQLANPFPSFLLVIVVCWSVALFFGTGLISALNAVTVAAAAAGAILVSSAIFLILELSHPYSGVFRISPVGIDRLQRALDEAEATKAT